MSITPVELFGDLHLLKLNFKAAVSENATLPRNLGSALRGLLGWQLQRLTCPFGRGQPCPTCTINDHCPYFLLFEKKSDMPGLADSPRGYIVDPEPYENDGKLRFSITMLGDCCRTAPAVTKALINGGQSGLGHKRNLYRMTHLEEVQPSGAVIRLPVTEKSCQHCQGPYPLRSWLAEQNNMESTDFTARLVSPVRLRRKGKYLGRMNWPFFFASLARRMEGLNCIFNNGRPLGREIWQNINVEFSKFQVTEEDLHWHDLRRYSNRQKRKVPLGGLTGSVKVRQSSSVCRQWWRAASFVHVGKGAVMGLGKVKVRSAIH